MLRGRLEIDDRRFRRALAEFGPKVDGFIHATFDYQSHKMLGHAKVNAPWTDRTGNARNGLSVEVGWVPLVSHSIRLFHRVTYGIFLETRWGGRYAIILPTIRLYGRDTMRLLNKLFAKMKTQGVVP